jgi:UDP-N-acetyl-D-mannosaminuronic acid dehydrogenase
MRGTPIEAMMPLFRAAGMTVLGHDPMVAPDVLRRYGGEPVDVATAFRDADAVLIVNDHPEYRAIGLDGLLGGRPRVLYDSWRILDETAVTAAGVRYAGLGYRAPAPVGPPIPPAPADPAGLVPLAAPAVAP